MKNRIKGPRWALQWIKNIGPDPDMLEICKKDEKIYREVFELVLQGERK